MKKLIVLISFFVAGISSFAQIENGFYLRLGPAFPLGDFNSDQLVGLESGYWDGYALFPNSKIGYNFELGCHFYTGKAFAGEKVRIGIDATFYNSSLHPADYDSYYGYNTSGEKNFYLFLRQKVGPIVTYSPKTDMYIDFGVRLVPTIAYLFGDTYDIWGRHINEEILFNFRWKVLMASLQFDIGKVNMNDFSGDGYMIGSSTFNLLFGMKF
jgi:hypothetical protein